MSETLGHFYFIFRQQKLFFPRGVYEFFFRQKLAAEIAAAEKLAEERAAADKLAAEKAAADKRAAERLAAAKSAAFSRSFSVSAPDFQVKLRRVFRGCTDTLQRILSTQAASHTHQHDRKEKH